MDKIDQQIKESAQIYEPKQEFVETTMQKVEATGAPKKRWLNWKVLTSTAGTVTVVAIAIFVFVPHSNSPTASTTTGGSKAEIDSQSQTAVNAPINPTNTTDTALDSDLSSVRASLTQSSSDQSTADNSINDNQQQVSIPTE